MVSTWASYTRAVYARLLQRELGAYPTVASKPSRPGPHLVTRIPRAALFSCLTVSRTPCGGVFGFGNEPSPIPMMLVGR